MKGQVNKMAYLAVGVIIAVFALGVAVNFISGTADAQSSLRGSSKAVDLATAINDTCKQRGKTRDRSTVALNENEVLEVTGEEVILRSDDDTFQSDPLTGCTENDITVVERSYEQGGRFFIELSNGEVDVLK